MFFFVSGEIDLLLKHAYATLKILISAVTCSSTIRTKRIVAFTRTRQIVKLHVPCLSANFESFY